MRRIALLFILAALAIVVMSVSATPAVACEDCGGVKGLTNAFNVMLEKGITSNGFPIVSKICGNSCSIT